MAQPFDYSLNVPSPLEAGAQAFKLGAGIAATEEQARAYQQERQMAALQQQQAMEQERMAREAINAALDPNATWREITRAQFFTKNKEQMEALANWGKTLDVERAKPMVNRLLMVAGPLAHNNPKVAIANLEREFAANEGNPAAQAEIQSRMDEINANPAAAASRSMAELSLLPGGDQAVTNLLKLTGEKRAQLKADYEAQEGVAKAQQAQVAAQYAEQEKQQTIKNLIANGVLTRAQAARVNQETKNLTSTGQMLALDYTAAAQGLPIPSKGGGTKPAAAATEDERKAAGWLAQADNAYKNMLSAMFTKTGKPTGAEKPGLVEAVIPYGQGFVRSTNRQKFVQASESLGEAILRAATGAGVNKDEAAQKARELTPTFSDDADTRKQKLEAIPMYLRSLQTRAGRAAPEGYQIPEPPVQTQPGAVQGQPPGIPQGFRIVGKR